MEQFIAELAPITEVQDDKTADKIYGIGDGNSTAEQTPEYKMIVMGGGGVGDTFEFRDSDYDHPDDIDLFPAGVADSAERSVDLLSNQAAFEPLELVLPSDDLSGSTSLESFADQILG